MSYEHQLLLTEIEMKRKILSALLLCGAQACFRMFGAEAAELQPLSDLASVQPVSIEELKQYLVGKDFVQPHKEDVDKFFKAFSGLQGYSREDKKTIRWEAVGLLAKIVSLVQTSFARELKHLRTNLSETGFEDLQYISPIRQYQHYREHQHQYFLRFQQMVNDLLNWDLQGNATIAKIQGVSTTELPKIIGEVKSEMARALREPYGVCRPLKILWLKDRNGLVPQTFQKDLITEKIYSAPFLYGDWGGPYQMRPMIINGELVESSGVYVRSTAGDGFYSFSFETGKAGNFLSWSTKVCIKAGDPIIRYLKDSGALKSEQKVGRSGHAELFEEAFIPLPSTSEEQKEFEAVLLEELHADLSGGVEESAFAQEFLSAYVRSLEWNPSKVEELDDAVVETPLVGKTLSVTSLPDVLTQRIDNLYEEQVRKEQEAVSKRVSEGDVVGHPHKPEKGKKKKHAPASSPNSTPAAGQSAVTDAAMAEKRAQIIAGIRAQRLNYLKEQGRVKWRTLARMIITSLKSSIHDNKLMIDCSGRGSHFGLRLKGGAEAAGLTVVRPHGKSDRTVSAGEARNLAEDLIKLTFKVMRGEQETTPSK
jgi:hypothetical protein